MKEDVIECMDTISKFCRIQTNIKRDLPIRSSEMGVLIYVKKSEKPATPLMISKFFGIAKPSVSDMVNSLVKKDYLMKTPSKDDKRSYILKVTEKGQKLLDTTYNEYFAAVDMLEKNMGNEKFKLLIELMKEANEILKEETR